MRGHLSSYHHTLTNVRIRATARRPGMTAMGAIRPVSITTWTSATHPCPPLCRTWADALVDPYWTRRTGFRRRQHDDQLKQR